VDASDEVKPRCLLQEFFVVAERRRATNLDLAARIKLPILRLADGARQRDASAAYVHHRPLMLRKIGFLGKVLTAIGLMALLVWLSDPSEILRLIAGVDKLLLLIGFCAILALIPLGVSRWHLILHSRKAQIGWWTVARLVLIGQFFNQFLPSSLGGDVARGWLAVRSGVPVSTLVGSILVDRLAGLLAALFLVVVGLPRLSATVPPDLLWSVVVLVVGLLIGLGIAASADTLVPRRWLRGKIGHVAGVWHDVRAQMKSVTGLFALVLSLAIHLITIGAIMLFAWTIGLDIGYRECLVVVPIALIASAVPISIAGWGVREGVMVVGFGLYGIDPEKALIPSLFLGFATAVAALPGGCLWLNIRRASTAWQKAGERQMALQATSGEAGFSRTPANL
jgi:glycosyltransferase 2 family protein